MGFAALYPSYALLLRKPGSSPIRRQLCSIANMTVAGS
jgi:hypothetical protein